MPTLPELTTATPRGSRARSGRTGPLLVIGAGSVGTRHAQNLGALGFEDLLFYRTGHGAPQREGRSTTDLDEALALQPAAALVCNPTALHVETALLAARSGCHLFIEKPVSHALDGLDALAAEVAARRLVVLVGYQFRFHPGLRRVKEWLAEGAIGEVTSARARWGEYLPGWHPGEDYTKSYSARRELGGGVVVTLSHPFDYLRWLLGEVVEVSAQTGQRGGFELDVEDTANVLLRFESGVLASVSLDYVERPASHRLHLVGRNGLISWDGITGVARLHDAARGEVQSVSPPPGFDRNSMFLDEVKHFMACVRGRERPACGLDDGVAALRIALAAKRSAEEGLTVRV
ncbi:MAG TPA: Gfo/Idh/MocA family oxidoreductase [Vicinamibacteria bacterium]